MSITSETTVRRKPDALYAGIGAEIVLMSTDCDKYYGLDAIGSDVWKRLEAPITVERLCGELADSYEGPPQAIQSDVIALLEQLLQNGLIESVAAVDA